MMQEKKIKVHQLSKELKILRENEKIVTIMSQTKKYESIINTSIESLTKDLKMNGIYVSLSLPHKEVVSLLKKTKVDFNRLYFIDASKKVNEIEEGVDADNCTRIKNPQSLTEISLAITTAANTGKFQFLLFDSFTTLMIFNNLKTVEKFSVFLLSKIKNLHFSGIIFVIDKETFMQLSPIISQWCDVGYEIK